MQDRLWDTVTHGTAETEKIGAALARRIADERAAGNRGTDGVTFVALNGDLGAGKTAFVRGMASVLAPSAAVCSPTYTVVNTYRTGSEPLCHFDMYRLEDEEDLYAIGFYDYTDCVIAAEWCEKVRACLPDDRYDVNIDKIPDDPDSRRIVIERRNPR